MFKFFKNRSIPSEISFSVLLTVLFILQKGYSFNSGDHADHLEPLYEKIFPGIFKGDFFMDYQAEAFSIRQLYIYGLYILSYFAPISFWCFLLNFVSIFSSIWAWTKISFIITGNAIVKYLAPMAIFTLFYGFTVGGNNIMYTQFTCGVVAKALAPWGILYFLKSKFNVSALFLAVATAFHPIVGLQLFLILAALLILDFSEVGVESFLSYILVYVLCCFPILYLNFKVQFFNPFQYDKNLYNNIYFHFRNPHHYIPSYFPIIQWIKYLVIILMLVTLMLTKKHLRHGKVIQFIAIQTIGLISYTLLIEGFHIYTFASIQWYKTTIWVVAFASIIIGQWISEFHLIKQLWAKTQSLVENSYLHLGFAIIGLFFILNSKYIPIERLKDNFQIGNAPVSELKAVHLWIKDNTPLHSVFLAPPSDFGFGCESYRPSLINAKAIVHEPKYLLLWYSRFSTVYKTKLEDLQGKSFVEKAEENYRKGIFDASFYNADYALVYKPYLRNDTVVFQTEKYAVVKL